MGMKVYGEVPAIGVPAIIAQKTSANMAVTTDQAMTAMTPFSSFLVTGLIITNASTTPVAASIGLYTGASKGGLGIVTSGLLTALTASNLALDTFTLGPRLIATNTWFVSNAAANAAALTADVYLVGIPLS